MLEQQKRLQFYEHNHLKIIFYPDRIYGTNEFIDFFSLSNMGLSDDITEIVFCKEKQEKIIEELLAIL